MKATPELVAACIRRRLDALHCPLTEEQFARMIEVCRAREGFPGLEGAERKLEREACYRAAHRARKCGRRPPVR